MRSGDRLVLLFNRKFWCQVKLPAPPTLTNALNHLAQLEPHVRANLVVVTLVAESIVPAEEALAAMAADRTPTEPAPPMTESEFHAEVVGG